MKILLIVNNPSSSLDVLAQATITSVEKHGLKVFVLYRTMFLNEIKVYPELLSQFKLVHFLQGVESFPYELVKLVSHYCPIISNHNHCEFQELPRQFKLVEHLFYLSRCLETELELFGLSNEQMTLVYPGVDTARFVPKTELKSSRKFLIGFFGTQPPNSWDRKGSVLLVRAARRILDLGYRPSFLIVGYGWQTLVADLSKMGFNIDYHINVPSDTLPQLYQQLDLYLITSLVEGGPLTLLEAGACGIPIISTPVGLSLEILKKPGCGKLLSKFDSDEIANAVIADLVNREQAQERANCVLTEIRKHWDWKYTYQNLHEVYLKIGQKKQTPKKISSFPIDILMPYLNFEQDPQQQRQIARKYASADLALRLYSHGDHIAAWRMTLPLLTKINPRYWWKILQENAIK